MRLRYPINCDQNSCEHYSSLPTRGRLLQYSEVNHLPQLVMAIRVGYRILFEVFAANNRKHFIGSRDRHLERPMAAKKQKSSVFQIKVHGTPKGRIPVPELVKICEELQQAVLRQAEASAGKISLHPGPSS